MEFGHKIKDLWYLGNEYTYLNHGSFGATPKQIISKQREYQELMELEPVDFFMTKYPTLIEPVIKKLAKFINVNAKNLFFIENATGGVNTILRALLPKIDSNYEITYISHIYPAVRQTLNYIADSTGCKLHEIKIPYPTSKSEIIDIFKKEFNPKTNLTLIDHIASATAVVFPVKELTEIAKSKGSLVLIDAAHSIGTFKIDVESYNCDFYTTNNHKWLMAPKGSALLWVNDNFLNEVHPLTISHDYKKSINREFEWTGTKDVSQWIATGDTLDFYLSFGENKISEYIRDLNLKAKDFLTDALNLPKIDNEIIHSMTTLPYTFKNFENVDDLLNYRQQLLQNFGIELFATIFEGKPWFRICSQIYNQFEDYEKLLLAFKTL